MSDHDMALLRIEHLEAEIERLKRDYAALELECASWKQSSGLKLDEIKRLRAENGRVRVALTNAMFLLRKHNLIIDVPIKALHPETCGEVLRKNPGSGGDFS